MKTLIPFAAVGLLAFGCQCEQAPTPDSSATVTATPVAFNTDGSPTVTFEVPDMMCQYSCVDAVKTALVSQPGVKEVRIDFAAKQAIVVVDQSEFNGEAAVASLVDYQFTNSKLHKSE